jgi:hypothetical protein
MKDKGKNLATLNYAMSVVVFLWFFQLEKLFLAHVLNMWCQSSANMLHDEKVCQGIKEVSFKDAQSTFQKSITWIKKS